jgi:hypothetical protein
MIDQNIPQNEFISTLISYSHNLQLNVEEVHYESNSEYYWKNKNQFISVINKGIPDDKLKIIFQTHIQKLTKNNNNHQNNNNINSEKDQEHIQICYPPVHIVKTEKFSVYAWA